MATNNAVTAQATFPNEQMTAWSTDETVTAIGSAAQGESLPTITHTLIEVHAVWTGLDAADAVVKLQTSNDGTNWADVTGATITLATTPASSDFINYLRHGGEFIRWDYDPGTVTAGTLALQTHIKVQ